MADLESPLVIIPPRIVAAQPVVRLPSREMLEAQKRARQAQAAERRRRKAEKRAIATSRRQAKKGKARRKQAHR